MPATTPTGLSRGAARETVDPDQVASLRAAGVLVEDPRRERPRWFDGRFLAARDLVRDQQYVLTREADLGRAAGSGVAAGLHVSEAGGPQRLAIDAGHGVTPAGELVLLPRRLEVALADIAAVEQLSARFGLGRIPNPPLRSRTGLFVLALRPVEYTANPIGAYPSTLTGQRTVEDGDVIEATAVVLVPWADDGAADALDARRGRVARAVFVGAGSSADGAAHGTGDSVLPLAMVALQNNAVVWIDEGLVRRELGADRGDLPGLGFSPRALRLAHLMQYQQHLADVVQATGGARFPALAHFPALPPTGPLPDGAIDPGDFTQSFFPAEIDIDITPIPDDELPALVEDALALPPIDLTVAAEALDSTAVIVVAPVPRREWRAVVARLTTVTRVVKPAAPNLLAQRKPFEILQKLRLPRVAQAPDATNPSDAEWQRLVRLPGLWFVRRRQIALRDDYAGAWQAVTGIDERTVENRLRTRLAGLGLAPQLDRLLRTATPAAAGTAVQLLSSPRFTASPALTAAALGVLTAGQGGAGTAATPPTGGGTGDVAPSPAPAPSDTASESTMPAVATAALDHAAVLKVAAQLAAPGTGTGLERLERAADGGKLDPQALQKLASSGTEWQKLDAAATAARPARLAALAGNVVRVRGGAATTSEGDGRTDAAKATDGAATQDATKASSSSDASAPAALPVAAIDPVDSSEKGSTVVSPPPADAASPTVKPTRPLSPRRSSKPSK